jgi:hypothetical protein
MNRLPEPEYGEEMPLILSDDPAYHRSDCEYCEGMNAAR